MHSLEEEKEELKVEKKEEPDTTPKEEDTTPQEEEDKWFQCYSCNMKELYDVKGEKVEFCRNIIFAEDSYVVRDPFTPPDKRQFFILGSDCFSCKNPVCQSNECSIFYKHRYCQKCALEKIDSFPEQLRPKIKKS